MVNWGISSIKIFKKPPQNIQVNANEENGAANTLNPPKFEINIWSNSTFPEHIRVIIDANFKLLLSHSRNSRFFVISKDNIQKANKMFIAKGIATNIILQL